MKMQMTLHCHTCQKNFRKTANRKRLVHRVLESECNECKLLPLELAGKYSRIDVQPEGETIKKRKEEK